MKTKSFFGALLFLVLAIIAFANGAWTYGTGFVIGFIVFTALWYWLWSRDNPLLLQMINRLSEPKREQPPIVQKQRKVPMSNPRSNRMFIDHDK